LQQTGSVILSCLALGLALNASVAAAEVTALRIFNKSFDAETQELKYELWNESAQTVTAWRLSLARGDSLGAGQRSILDQDFFDRQPSGELGARFGPIVPGSSVEAQWLVDVGARDFGPTALSLRVSAVVFEDMTWEGDPDAASSILEARRARVEEIGKVLAALEDHDRQPWSSQSWPAALKRRAQELKSQGEDPERSGGGRREVAAVIAATKLELARWLEDASREISLAPDPHQAMGSLAGSLRERYESGLQAIPQQGTLVNPQALETGGEW
jgi:hypothetical protein